jgi:hypothetical protein
MEWNGMLNENEMEGRPNEPHEQTGERTSGAWADYWLTPVSRGRRTACSGQGIETETDVCICELVDAEDVRAMRCPPSTVTLSHFGAIYRGVWRTRVAPVEITV